MMRAASWAAGKAVLLALVLLEGIAPQVEGIGQGFTETLGSHKKLGLVGTFLISKWKIAALTGPLKISGS